jgi:hypothetical protein
MRYSISRNDERLSELAIGIPVKTLGESRRSMLLVRLEYLDKFKKRLVTCWGDESCDEFLTFNCTSEFHRVEEHVADDVRLRRSGCSRTNRATSVNQASPTEPTLHL